MPSPVPQFPIRRNTALLSAAMAVNSAALQLSAAMSAISFALVTGIRGLLGLGPAISMVSGAMAAVVAGRAMDRFGRIPVLAAGFLVGMSGTATMALALHSGVPVLAGLGAAFVGASAGTVQLSRAAAGDMYPPDRRARGIAWVLFGSVFGAILGPAVFAPIFSGREVEASALVVPWLIGSVVALVGFLVVVQVRPDPMRIAEAMGHGSVIRSEGKVPLRQILARPGAIPALLAGLTSFAVMASVMNLTGYIVVGHHHHAQHLVFPIIGAHVLGMYALAPMIGSFIDRIGKRPALVGGLVVIAVSCFGLVEASGVWTIGILLFGLGVGWNLAFVAATVGLTEVAAPAERGRLLGFHDMTGGVLAAVLVLLGGWVLEEVGVYAVAAGATVIALVPVALILWKSTRPKGVNVD